MLAAGIGFLAALALIFVRVPIAIALAVVGFIGYAMLNAMAPAFSVMGLTALSSTMSYNLAVVPLFILMGNLVAGAGISQELYRAAQVFVGHRRGGLGIATILSCGGFAAVCGSSVATAVTMGRVAIPSMRSYGYSDSLSTATVAAGGTLGILIPPSIIMVIYGITTETHIGMLFAAGIIPGLIGIVGYSVAVNWVARRHPERAPRAEKSSRPERIDAIKNVWAVCALFILVLGGIYGGFFTATEASGIGACGALAFALLRRTSLKDLIEIFRTSAETTAVLFALIIGASVFSEFVNLTGAHQGVLAVVQNGSLSPVMVIMVICAIYV
ncbi:MAG: TRAP transporter large permease subunit, partial [Paracoccaceae bacterium]